MIMMTNDSYAWVRSCHVLGVLHVSHLIFIITIWISQIIIPILQMKNPRLGDVILLKVTWLVQERDRIQIQVCSTSKITSFAKPGYATPQSCVSFGLTQRAESHILIPETQPREDHRQRSFYFLLSYQDHLLDISLTSEDTEISITLPKCLWLEYTLFLSQVYLDY